MVVALGGIDVTCYQMDLYQAERLRVELDAQYISAKVVTAADLWDLPANFQTVLYPVSRASERSLKIDMVEQAFHVLRPQGTLLVWSDYETDQLFPGLLKKVFGRIHNPPIEGGTLLWCQRGGDRPRRRHEVVYQVRADEEFSVRFISRPGTFSYGRFDHGARALIECAAIERGDHILDLGCGCGTNGIIAALRAGPEGSVTFIDSNVRAVTLAQENARRCGVTHFAAFASSRVEGPAAAEFDVALANPPYYAQGSIARLFLERARELLRPGGRLYLVTRQPEQVETHIAEIFAHVEAVERRGYIVFAACVSGGGNDLASLFR